MNATDRQHQLERLVDGELSPDEERVLLLSLDDVSCEWRELALMFLEDRALRRDLPFLALDEPASGAPARRIANRAVGSALAGWLAALALTALAAFWIGRGAPVPVVEPSGDRVANAPDAVSTAVDSDLREDPTAPDGLTEIAATEIPEATEYVAMKLIGSDDVDLQEVNVPLYDEAQWTQTSATTARLPFVPDEVRDAFLRRGQTVVETTEFISVQFVDGRSAVIPITSIEVRPLRPDEIR